MEYFDVLDKDRNFLNKTYVRGTKLNEEEFNAGVEIFITSNNKLLLSQRCLLKSHPLEWEAQGGCVVAGDNSIKTVHKELQEEIGLTLKEDPKFITTDLYKNQFVDIYTIDLKENSNNFKLQEEEVNDIKWVDEEEFKEMVKQNQIVASVLNRFQKVKNELNLNWKL